MPRAVRVLGLNPLRRQRARSRNTSKSTGKPSPPRMTATSIGRHTHGSDTKGTSPLGKSEKPALLNEDTAWNPPFQAAVPHGSS